MVHYIEKGKHYSRTALERFALFTKWGRFERAYRLTNSCWYPRSAVRWTGWNKLGGVFGGFIHLRSARVVWQPEWGSQSVKMFRIAAYVYTGEPQDLIRVKFLWWHVKASRWKYKLLGLVRVDERFVIKIRYEKNRVHFTFQPANENPITHTIEAKRPRLPIFRGDCYFGGKAPSPQNMIIKEYEL